MSAAPRRTKRTYLSWALFAASIALFAVVGYLYWQDRTDEEQIPTPPSNPGRQQLVNVTQALEAQGLDVEIGRSGGARARELSTPGQDLVIGDAIVYAFIYPGGPAVREEDTDGLDPAGLTLVNIRGTPVAGDPPRVFMGSNVVAALVGGDDELAAKVQSAIEGLP